jgi:archaellum biogenesis protein FlaJ (TadC family)
MNNRYWIFILIFSQLSMALVQDKSIIKSLIEQKEKELEILNFEIQKIREEIK